MNTTVETLLETRGINTVAVGADDTVYEAVRRMAEHRIGAVIVLGAGGAVEGILSERDCFNKVLLAETAARKVKVGEIMTRDLITVSSERTVEDCLALMNECHIRHLPVMRGVTFAGLISMRDVVRHIAEERGLMIKNLEKYIGGAM